MQGSPLERLALPPSRAEFDAFYREHAAFVVRVLRRLAVREEALEDALQEVFLVVHRRWDERRPGPTPRGWLFAIAQRVAFGQRRWVRRKGGLLPLPEDLASRGPSPLDGAIEREASDLVQAFLEQLDEPRRAAFVLTELEEMTGAEAHLALGVNQRTLYSRLTSARRAFLEFLRQGGVLEEDER